MRTEASPLRAFATLRFEGDALDPSAVTDILQVPPTLAYRKGELFKLGKRGLEKVGQTGYWFLNTKGLVGTHDLNDHANFLIERLAGEASRFDRLKAVVEMEALCTLLTLFWFGQAGATPPPLNSRLENLIGSLRGGIETDFSTKGRDPGAVEGRAA
ncbi:DUF4279 domain-containing protein [Methylobacterium sp. E-066]|nr:DUF4279 domain-containing protein [Methylobacterium sp. E-066]